MKRTLLLGVFCCLMTPFNLSAGLTQTVCTIAGAVLLVKAIASIPYDIYLHQKYLKTLEQYNLSESDLTPIQKKAIKKVIYWETDAYDIRSFANKYRLYMSELQSPHMLSMLAELYWRHTPSEEEVEKFKAIIS